MIIEDFIIENARLFPDKVALVCPDMTCTYLQLYEYVKKRMTYWNNRISTNQQVVTLRASQTAAFIIDYFALHSIGKTVAPLEHSMPESQFASIAETLNNSCVPEGIADILYTTGTTGQSKGVMISHNTIVADAENLIEGQGFYENLSFIVNGPLNHIGSLSKIYPVIMLGATLVVIEGMKDINGFFDAMNYGDSKTATFLVPASIRILLQFAHNKLAALSDKIDFIETGAAPIAHSDMLELCRLLPNTRLYNTYASTETGIIATYNFNDGRCLEGCLGLPMKHSSFIITPEGKIACQGATLMSGYVNDEKMTQSVLRDNMVYTSDMGYVDEEGMLHLSGREDDVINIGGFKVAPVEVENVALQLPEVVDCVCVKTDHPIMGTALKLLVAVSENSLLDKKRIARFLNSQLETYKVPVIYQQVETVKRTFNGKIDRKYYKSPENT